MFYLILQDQIHTSNFSMQNWRKSLQKALLNIFFQWILICSFSTFCLRYLSAINYIWKQVIKIKYKTIFAFDISNVSIRSNMRIYGLFQWIYYKSNRRIYIVDHRILNYAWFRNLLRTSKNVEKWVSIKIKF